MVFGPWIEAGAWVRARVPSPRRFRLRKPHFNFITLHYLYLIGWAIVGSILIYSAGGLPYIDALFFASGAVTQAGLNTVDINTVTLYQQIVMMLIACVCNPIFVHTFVVFIRLYWFEKRFQNIVKEARQWRRTRSRSRTRSEAKGDRDLDREERGVNGREIKVLRSPDGHAQARKLDEKDNVVQDLAPAESSFSSEETEGPRGERPPNGAASDAAEQITSFHRDIVFADEIRPSGRLSNLERIPERRTAEQHIAFVENQRNPKDKTALRIPGPRDFERGHRPRRLEEGEDGDELDREMLRDGYDDEVAVESDDELSESRGRERSSHEDPPRPSGDGQSFKRNITIDEPDHPNAHRPRSKSTFSKFASLGSTSRVATAREGSTMTLRQRARSTTLGSYLASRSQERDPMPYLSWTPTIGRNSTFVDLTEEQREELGGIEYRALKTLAFILVVYYVGFHLLGMICLLPWIVRSMHYGNIVREDGVNPVWWGFFTPASMFNDLGFTLTPDSMISFQDAIFPLLLGTFLIIIGNTGFPCMLRLIIWIAEKFVPHGSAVWEELRFLLDHPRRCFTLLFPSNATWWLFWVLVLLNGVDLIFFIILDLNDPTVTNLPPGIRFLDGLFQAASTRTAGFACVNVADLHPAIQVSYLIMMYISVFPIAISMRKTNVYEERSLGVFQSEDDEDGKEHSYVGAHLRRQLSFDLWYVFLGLFLIALIEGKRIENTNDYAFTQFSILFEIVSAYGTVGVSLGYPGINASFSAEFKTLSKLIIIAMQIRGRHRGLPYALDRAILLPSEALHRQDEGVSQRARRGSSASRISGAGMQGVGDNKSQHPGPGLGNAAATLPSAATMRRASTARDDDPDAAGKPLQRRGTGLGLTRLLSGALSAGPSVPREKRID